MTVDGEMDGLKYLEHKPGLRMRENTIRAWCDYLEDFKGWELYVPD